MKKTFFIFFLFCVLALPSFALAIELNVPIGLKTEVDNFSQYVALWYGFVLGAVGIIAAVMIMWGGFKWLVSRGEPEAIKDAKERIIAALSGLILAFLSYMILNLINPNLVNLKMPELKTMPSTQTTGVDVRAVTGDRQLESPYSEIQGCCSFIFDDGSESCEGAESVNYCDRMKESFGDAMTSSSFFAELYCNYNTQHCEIKSEPAE